MHQLLYAKNRVGEKYLASRQQCPLSRQICKATSSKMILYSEKERVA